MRIFLLGVAVALLFGGAARADNFDDPKALVQAIYQPYTRGEQPANIEGYYTDGLKNLFAKHLQQAEYSGGIGTKIDVAATREPVFDPFVNAKHYLLLDLSITDAVVDGDHAVVNVTYKNFDHPSVLTISLQKTATQGWKVDDVASLGADQHWLLSWLLANDPWAVN